MRVDRDRGDVSAEVGRPGEGSGGDGRVPGLVRDLHARVDGLLRDAVAEQVVEVVEAAEEPGEERVPVFRHGIGCSVEEGLVAGAVGVVVGDEQVRFQRAEERDLRDAARTVPGEVSGDLAGAH